MALIWIFPVAGPSTAALVFARSKCENLRATAGCAGCAMGRAAQAAGTAFGWARSGRVATARPAPPFASREPPKITRADKPEAKLTPASPALLPHPYLDAGHQVEFAMEMSGCTESGLRQFIGARHCRRDSPVRQSRFVVRALPGLQSPLGPASTCVAKQYPARSPADPSPRPAWGCLGLPAGLPGARAGRGRTGSTAPSRPTPRSARTLSHAASQTL